MERLALSSTIAVEKAMGPAATSEFRATGESLAAHRHSVWTARVEAAAARRANEAGYFAASR